MQGLWYIKYTGALAKTPMAGRPRTAMNRRWRWWGWVGVSAPLQATDPTMNPCAQRILLMWQIDLLGEHPIQQLLRTQHTWKCCKSEPSAHSSRWHVRAGTARAEWTAFSWTSQAYGVQMRPGLTAINTEETYTPYCPLGVFLVHPSKQL